MNKYRFEAASPESVGINSKRIIDFIKRLDKCGLDMHSILLLKDNKLVCEAHYAPYTRERLHRMFSVTKSFVSLAVGILAGDGVIDLDSPITDYFPEYKPDGGFHPYLRETTIRNMLTMTTPHKGTTFDKNSSKGWTESYFTASPSHRPGTVFSYDTSASHCLAALVEKLTGKTLLDFLRDCGFTKLGFSGEAYCISDGDGVSQGGSGLMARPLDILAVADMVMSGGLGIVPKGYIEKATAYQVPTFVKSSFLEEAQGYGYQFWRVRNGGYMMYGMAGQLAVCIPEKNLILVTTADFTDRKDGMQLLFEAFWNELCSHIGEDIFDEKQNEELKCLIVGLEIKPLAEGEIKEFSNEFEFSDNNPLGLTRLIVKTENGGGMAELVRDGETQRIDFGFGKMREGVFTKYNCPYAASGSWTDDNTLVIKANLIGECIGKVYVQFSFLKPGAVTVFMRKTEGVLFNEYSGFAQSETRLGG